MKNFLLVAAGLDMTPVRQELMLHPELWGAEKFREEYANSPHVDATDIVLRYSPPEALDRANTALAQNSNTSVWYPASRILQTWKPLVRALATKVEAYSLERAMFVSLPPGGRILPHADVQGSYVNMGDIVRYHLVVQALPGVIFRGDDEIVQMQTGEVWLFNAHCQHEIMNNSADRKSVV